MRAERSSLARAGFSLVEILVALLLLGTFAGSAILVLLSGVRSAESSLARQDLEGRAQRALERIAREVQRAGASVLVPDPTAPFGSDSLVYQRVEGLDADEDVVWGIPQRLALQLEEGEEDDGLDDDGDGLVDEQELVWTSDPGGAREQRAVWAHRVREYLEGEEPNGLDDNGNGLIDERGLCFARRGGRVTILLSLLERTERGELVCSVQTSVSLRN